MESLLEVRISNRKESDAEVYVPVNLDQDGKVHDAFGQSSSFSVASNRGLKSTSRPVHPGSHSLSIKRFARSVSPVSYHAQYLVMFSWPNCAIYQDRSSKSKKSVTSVDACFVCTAVGLTCILGTIFFATPTMKDDFGSLLRYQLDFERQSGRLKLRQGIGESWKKNKTGFSVLDSLPRPLSLSNDPNKAVIDCQERPEGIVGCSVG